MSTPVKAEVASTVGSPMRGAEAPSAAGFMDGCKAEPTDHDHQEMSPEAPMEVCKEQLEDQDDEAMFDQIFADEVAEAGAVSQHHTEMPGGTGGDIDGFAKLEGPLDFESSVPTDFSYAASETASSTRASRTPSRATAGHPPADGRLGGPRGEPSGIAPTSPMRAATEVHPSSPHPARGEAVSTPPSLRTPPPNRSGTPHSDARGSGTLAPSSVYLHGIAAVPILAGADGEAYDEEVLELPMSSASLNGSLPAGQMFSSIARIRSTVNTYCNRLTEPGWFEGFKTPTIKALQRRLTNHQASIIGKFHTDVEIGFRQLQCRLAALLNLHKALITWNESCVADRLADALPHMKVLQDYLYAQDMCLAPDLQVLATVGLFHFHLRTTDIATAFQRIDTDKLEEWYQALNDIAPKKGGSVKTEVGDEQDPSAQDDASKAETSSAGSKRRRLCKGSLSYEVAAPPEHHLQLMLRDSVKMFLFRLPETIPNDAEALSKVVDTLERVYRWWVGLDMSSEALRSSATVLSSVQVVFQCCHSEEQQRPTTEAARSARKHLFDIAKTNHPLAEWSKNLYSFPCKTAMAVAKNYIADNLADEATTATFNASVHLINEKLGDACDDAEVWISTGNDGQPHDMVSFGPVLDILASFAGDVHHAADNWSSSALQTRADVVMKGIMFSEGIFQLAMRVQVVAVSKGLLSHLREAVGSLQGQATRPSLASGAPAVVDGNGPDETAGDQVAAGGDDAGTEALQVCSKALGQACEVAETLHKTVEVYGQSMATAIGRVTNALERTRSRINPGTDWSRGWHADPATLGTAAGENTKLCLDMCSYVTACAFLWKAPVFALTSHTGPIDTDTNYMKRLQQFCNLHRSFSSSGPLALHDPSVLKGTDDNSNALAGVFMELTRTVGKSIHEKHALSTVTTCLSSLASSTIKVGAVHSDVAKCSTVGSLCALLILDPAPHALCPSQRFCLTGDAKDDNRLFKEQFGHHKIYNLLVQFWNTIGLTEVGLPGVHRPLPANQLMQTRHCSLVIEVTCIVRDIAILTACVCRDLLPKTEKQKPTAPSLTDLGGYITSMVGVLQRRLCHLEELLVNKLSMEIEQEGWRLWTSLSELRQWHRSVSICAGKLVDEVLTEYARKLTDTVTTCRSHLPAWEAVFEGPEKTFKEDLAVQILKGKTNLVAKNHNAVHQVLRSLADSARQLAVTPKITLHEITAQQVAIGQSTLRASVVANIVCQGVDLLVHSKSADDGPSRARSFMEMHQKATPEIPATSFWHELESLAQNHIAIKPSARKLAAGGTGRQVETPSKVKKEGTAAAAGSCAVSSASADGGSDIQSKPPPLKRTASSRSLQRLALA